MYYVTMTKKQKLFEKELDKNTCIYNIIKNKKLLKYICPFECGSFPIKFQRQ